MCLLGCQREHPGATEAYHTLSDAFVTKRYDGAFRSDTLFVAELIQTRQQLECSQLVDSVTYLLIEWELLTDRHDQAKVLLDGLGDSAYPMWLRANYHTELQQYDTAVLMLEQIAISGLTRSMMLKVNWLKGYNYEMLQRSTQAVQHYRNANDLGEVPRHIDYLVEATVHMGNVYYADNQDSIALVQYQEGLRLAQKHDVRRLIPACYYHIGKVMEHRNQLDQAVDQYMLGKAAADALGPDAGFLTQLLQNKLKKLQSR